MKLNLLLLVVLVASNLAQADNQAALYVDPAQGSDTNAGTLGSPFQTIGKARDAVRAINGSMTGDIVVYLRGGAVGRGLEPDESDAGAASDSGSLFDDTFDAEDPGSPPAGYTVDQSGGVIEVINIPGNGNRSVRMRDSNADNAIGTVLSKSIGEQSGIFSCTFRMKAGQTTNSMFFKVRDGEGKQACQVGFSGNGKLRYFYQSGSFTDIAAYSTGTWYTFRMEVDVRKQAFSLWIDDALVLGESLFFQPTGSLTTVEFSNTFKTGFFDLDFIRVESESVQSGLITTNGTPYSWMDQRYDTAGWAMADYELQDVSDDDHDGALTWEEYHAGTNPDDETSVLRLFSVSSEVDAFSFSWKTLRVRNYSIQTSATLLPDSWSNVSNPKFVAMPGDGGLKMFSTEMIDGRRFFRISID